MTAIRCMTCDVVFTNATAYLHFTHLCSGSTRDTAKDSPAVEQTTTAPNAPQHGAVVIPLRRPLWSTPVEPCLA